MPVILTGFDPAVDAGDAPLTAQVSIATLGVPASIANAGTYVSTVIPTYGMPHIAASAKMDQAGTLSVQRYLDVAGVVATQAATTQAMTKDTQSPVVDINDGKLAQSCKVSIVNGSTTAATVSNITVVMQSTTNITVTAAA